MLTALEKYFPRRLKTASFVMEIMVLGMPLCLDVFLSCLRITTVRTREPKNGTNGDGDHDGIANSHAMLIIDSLAASNNTYILQREWMHDGTCKIKMDFCFVLWLKIKGLRAR
jgi:hypothetical protein